MNKNNIKGHILAIFTIIIWSTTFTSTKILLLDLTPIEILFSRFLIGFITLWLFYPHRLPIKDKKEELYFLGAGITGITCYYLCENIALNISSVTDVGIIISIAPFFTGIIAHKFLETEKLTFTFILSFIISMLGVLLVSYSANGILAQGSFWGDVLAIIAAFSWGWYSVIVKKIEKFNYNIIGVTRHIFFYGILGMLPALYFYGFSPELQTLLKPQVLGNLLFLGLGASALCFYTWNSATKYIGAVKTSMYIYASPILLTLTAMLILHEQVTYLTVIGTILLLAGLIIAEKRK